MALAKENFISIGDNDRIVLPDLTGRYQQAVNIDYLLEELLPLWAVIETECVAACCGFDAFDFSADTIYDAARKLEPAEFSHSLHEAIEQITLLDVTVISSTYLNNLADKQAFITLLKHIRTSLPQGNE
ncbi:DUF6331 family protein [Pectobacterium actinidiae]|uniref:DUF6331 family protein n=1 Tax=Pectobacterium actinidiae TaxID=1507808 RepID=UPI001198B819|nr:DUF6331 family protein [Pectobacterium actinidiae]MDY4313512.1 DUF6331 family protein [Pectobacterium actinidiae]QDX97351.1 hypothetical protein EGD00_10080 [Pectobacterium carotovorum subsp. carotovorum]